jgi:hypothetical protein
MATNTLAVSLSNLCDFQIEPGTFGVALTSRCSGLSGFSIPWSRTISLSTSAF